MPLLCQPFYAQKVPKNGAWHHNGEEVASLSARATSATLVVIMMVRKLPGLGVPTNRACCAAACFAASSWSRRTRLVFGFGGLKGFASGWGTPALKVKGAWQITFFGVKSTFERLGSPVYKATDLMILELRKERTRIGITPDLKS